MIHFTSVFLRGFLNHRLKILQNHDLIYILWKLDSSFKNKLIQWFHTVSFNFISTKLSFKFRLQIIHL